MEFRRVLFRSDPEGMITLTRLVAVKEEPVVPVAARMEILDPCDQSEARRHEQRVFRVEREVSGFVGHRGGQRALHDARKIYELFGVDRAVLNIRTDDQPVPEPIE